MSSPRGLAVLALTSLAGCASTAVGRPDVVIPAVQNTPVAPAYSAATDAQAEFQQTLATAKARGRLALIVFGADWCHDSVALARALDSPALRPLIDAHYEVLFLDAGTPQSGRGRNMDLAAGLGVTDITGTPTLIVIGRDGRTLNADTARGWRNAASRKVDAIAAELAGYADEPR